MSKKKFFIPLLITVFLVPQITFASWWNPFSWGWFKKSTQNSTISTQMKIESSATDSSRNATSTKPRRDAVFYLSTKNPLDNTIEGYDLDKESSPRDILEDDSPVKVFYTIKEVSSHNSYSDCWVSNNKRVYNLTSLLLHVGVHPAVERLKELCGMDVTEIIKSSPVEAGSINTARVKYALATLVIGRLSDNPSDSSR